MKMAHLLRSSKKRSGFTLLELIGVLVVIALLLTTVIPSVINLIRVQRAVDEAAELPKIASALELAILREQMFPIDENDGATALSANPSFWWNLAARHGGGSANQVRYPVECGPARALRGSYILPKLAGQVAPFLRLLAMGRLGLRIPWIRANFDCC